MANTEMPPMTTLLLALQFSLMEFFAAPLLKILCAPNPANNQRFKSLCKCLYNINISELDYKGTKNVTASMRGVRINQGATELALMLSFAHSHAKLFANWLIAPTSQRYCLINNI